jgi:hypothetical protein
MTPLARTNSRKMCQTVVDFLKANFPPEYSEDLSVFQDGEFCFCVVTNREPLPSLTVAASIAMRAFEWAEEER